MIGPPIPPLPIGAPGEPGPMNGGCTRCSLTASAGLSLRPTFRVQVPARAANNVPASGPRAIATSLAAETMQSASATRARRGMSMNDHAGVTLLDDGRLAESIVEGAAPRGKAGRESPRPPTSSDVRLWG